MPLTDPVPSSSFDVLERNVQDTDKFVNQETGTFTNRVGQQVKPIPVIEAEANAAIASLGWDPAGEFATGFTYTKLNDVGRDTSGSWWRYNGSDLPKVITAGTVPSSPNFSVISFETADNVQWKIGKSVGYSLDDLQGFTDDLYAQSGTIDSGLPDVLGASQRVDAIKKLINKGSIYADDYSNGLIGALDAAVDGSVIVLSKKTYNICGYYFLDGVALNPTLWVGNLKKNLTIIGAGMPQYSEDGTRMVEGSGTIIQGLVLNWADGFQCIDLGVDCGSYVVDTLNGGVHMDGFVPGTLRTLTEIASQPETYTKDVYFHNIKTLLKDPVNGNASTYKHSFLVERIFGCGYSGHIEARGGYFGFVIKSQNVTGNSVVRLSGQKLGATYIHKSDQYSETKNVNIAGYHIGLQQDAQVPSCLWEAQGGTNLSNYVVGSIQGVNCKELLTQSPSSTDRMTDITIGAIQGGLMTGANGMFIGSLFDRVNIGTHNFVNCVNGIVTATGCTQVDIGSGSVRITAVNGYELAGDVTHGNIKGHTIANYTVKNSGAVINPELVSSDGTGIGLIDNLFTIDINYEGNWAASGFYPLIVNAWGGKLTFRGFVSAPSNNGTGTIFTLPVGFRPKRQEIFFVNSLVSGVWTNQYSIAFNTDGTVSSDAPNARDVCMSGIELRYNA